MNDIEIEVQPKYMTEQSNVMKDKYVFSYRITIYNRSENIVTLKKRHWEIIDAHGEVEKVSGIGVVGEQPVLYPGDDYEYSSGAHLNTPWGCMEGCYEFEDNYGERFSVPIPRFNLKADFTVQ